MDKRDTSTKQYSSIVLRITILFLAAVVSVNPVWARSSTEIGNDIVKKQQEIEENERKLAESAANKQRYEADVANLADGVPKLEAQIRQVEEELKALNLEISILEQEQSLKELEKERTQFAQNQTIKGSYMDWKSTSHDVRMFVDEAVEFSRIQQYQSAIAGNNKVSIENLTGELVKIEGQMSTLNNKKSDLETKTAEVQEQKRQLEQRLAQLRLGISYEAGNIGAIDGALKQGRQDLGFLTVEQRLAYERELLLQNQVPTNPGSGSAGSVSFLMRGRDAVQGHGVGLSQWGAHGMGQAGYQSDDIIKFYYTGVSIQSGFENRTVNVTGYGTMNIEDYAAGIAEIPDKACGNQDQVNSNPAKYTIDNPNTAWDCWPEETIKAKMIIARTYALFHSTVCTSAACQVFVGGNGKRWAVDETRGKVILYNGAFIDAVYSSDNNQGFGTADNDTIWQNFQGVGTPYPYLRSVNDNSVATHTYYTNKVCNTNGYSMSDIYDVLVYNSTSFYISGYRSLISNIINNLGGGVASISFERDASLRVKKVFITGTNGYTGQVGGYWFKQLWNEWVYNKNKVNTSNCQDLGSPRFDYLYSQTFFLN